MCIRDVQLTGFAINQNIFFANYQCCVVLTAIIVKSNNMIIGTYYDKLCNV